MPEPDFFRKGTVLGLLVLWASFSFSSALSEISFVAALLFWLGWKISRKSWQVETPKALLFILAAFMGWCILSWFWSEARPQSFRGIFKIAQQSMIFLIAADSFRAGDLKKWENLFIAMLALTILDAAWQAWLGKDFLRHIAAQYSGSGIRLSASFKTYGLLGCYLILTLPVALMIAQRAWKLKYPAWLSGILFFLFLSGSVVLYFTKSRGAMLAFGTSFVFLLFYFKNWRLLLLGMILAVTLFRALPKSTFIHLDAERKEQSLVERYYLWDRAVSVIRAKPLTGTGINTYAVAHQRYDTTKNWRVRNYYAHNGYLQLAAETGLPGLLLFLAFLSGQFLWSFKRLAQKRNTAPGKELLPLGLLSALLGFLVFALIDTVLHNEQAAMTFWYLLGLQAAYLSQRHLQTAGS